MPVFANKRPHLVQKDNGVLPRDFDFNSGQAFNDNWLQVTCSLEPARRQWSKVDLEEQPILGWLIPLSQVPPYIVADLAPMRDFGPRLLRGWSCLVAYRPLFSFDAVC